TCQNAQDAWRPFLSPSYPRKAKRLAGGKAATAPDREEDTKRPSLAGQLGLPSFAIAICSGLGRSYAFRSRDRTNPGMHATGIEHVPAGCGRLGGGADRASHGRDRMPVRPARVPIRRVLAPRHSPRMEIAVVMKQRIAIGLLGLTLAGCAQS